MRVAVLLGSLVWLVAEGASATSILYLEDLREIHAERSATTHSSAISKTANPAAPFAYFPRTVSAGESGASQTSAMDADQMTAIGWASGYLDIFTGNLEGYSIFHIRFEITESTPYSLSGSLSRQDVAGYIGSSAELRLSSGGADLYAVALPSGLQPITVPVSSSGVLTPGEYELFIAAVSPDAGLFGRSNYNVAFSIAPEPGATTLLLAGLLALAGRGLGSVRSRG